MTFQGPHAILQHKWVVFIARQKVGDSLNWIHRSPVQQVFELKGDIARQGVTKKDTHRLGFLQSLFREVQKEEANVVTDGFERGKASHELNGYSRMFKPSSLEKFGNNTRVLNRVIAVIRAQREKPYGETIDLALEQN